MPRIKLEPEELVIEYYSVNAGDWRCNQQRSYEVYAEGVPDITLRCATTTKQVLNHALCGVAPEQRLMARILEIPGVVGASFNAAEPSMLLVTTAHADGSDWPSVGPGVERLLREHFFPQLRAAKR